VVPRQRCGVLVKDVLTPISLAIFAAIRPASLVSNFGKRCLVIAAASAVIPNPANPAVQRRVTSRQ
jgi:hypothetical protein